MLKLENVCVAYDHMVALHGCCMEVHDSCIVTLLGANGAGKTTALHAIAGHVAKKSGSVTLDGEDVSKLPPHALVHCGISLVPEHRQLFHAMTLEENLLMGAYSRDSIASARSRLKDVYDLFPDLVVKRHIAAAMLSGGQQQMLAIGRALMARPRLLLLDEPSLGLAPLMIDRIFKAIEAINAAGITILIVEQNALRTLPMSSFGYVLESGTIVLSGPSQVLLGNPKVQESYLGAL